MRYPALLLLLLVSLTIHAQRPSREGSIPFNNGSIAYRVYGSGAPLLLVHAGFQDQGMWAPQLRELSGRFQVITFDLPGHGSSRGGPARPFAADIIRTVLDSLRIPKASILGLSLGSAVSVDFATQYPARVERLVMAAPGLPGWDEGRQLDTTTRQYITDLFGALERKDTAAAADVFVRAWYVGPERQRSSLSSRLWDYGYGTTLRSMQEHRVSGWPQFASPTAIHRLDSLRLPVFLLTGALDMPETLRVHAFLKEHVRGAREALLPEAAHMVNLERANAFNRLVLDFLEGK